MPIRWLYRTWSLFWTILGVTVLVVLLTGLLSLGALQLPVTKSLIANKIEQRFDERFNGSLELGTLTGTLPFDAGFDHVIVYSDSTRTDTALHTAKVEAGVDFLELLSGNIQVNYATVNNPGLKMDLSKGNGLIHALRSTQKDNVEDSSDVEASTFSVLAPIIRFVDGKIIITGVEADNRFFKTDTLTLDHLYLDMFLDYSDRQKYLDIEQLIVSIPEIGADQVQAFGQVFNDDRFLEFNSFNIRTAGSLLTFSGEADGIDLAKGNIADQFRSAEIDLFLKELVVSPNIVALLEPSLKELDESLYLSLNGEGTLDSLTFDDVSLALGESAVAGYGSLSNLLDKDRISYSANIEQMAIEEELIDVILPTIRDDHALLLSSAGYDGSVKGTADEVEIKAAIRSRKGSLRLDMNSNREAELYAGILYLDEVDLGNLINPVISKTSFNGELEFRLSSLDLRNGVGDAELKLSKGVINDFTFDTLGVNGYWENGLAYPAYLLSSSEAQVNGRGTVDYRNEIPVIEFTGDGTNIDVKALSGFNALDTSFVDVNYEFFLTGNTRENLYGQFSLDIPFSVVGGDTLPPHQFYADFSEPQINDERTLRITSTAIDGTLTGKFQPTKLPSIGAYWAAYLNDRLNKEILFRYTDLPAPSPRSFLDQNFEASLTFKNMELIKAYFPGLPQIKTNMQVDSDVNVNADRLLFNASLRDDEFRLNTLEADSLVMQLTGSFRHQETLKSFSGLQIQSEIGAIRSELISGSGISMNFEMDEDSITFDHSIEDIADGSTFYVNGRATLTDSTVDMDIYNFELGNNLYNWKNQGIPSLTYTNDERLVFDEFTFENLNEYLSFDGVFSDEPEDSVNYVIRSVNLERISDIINGRINFSGTLDGFFTTRSLTRVPTIQGDLSISRLAIDDQVVGDIDLESQFNRELNRFDTNISIVTDSLKYPEYFIRNQREGQNIQLSGYVLAPENGQFPEVDSLYNFDLDFESVDLWIIPFIAPKVFTEMSGRASGHGKVWGNADTYDFDLRYDVGMDDAVYFKPRFLETFYYGQGTVGFTRSEGLIFNDLFIIDPSGGMASLNGTYNLNDFQDTHLIDLELDMDEFQFLNNAFDPDVPFFGKAYGSSKLRLTGTNYAPVLSTITPVMISDYSNIGIPLLEETEFDEDNKFIRFVDSFEEVQSPNGSGSEANGFAVTEQEQDLSDLTFIERFTLDLQFVSNVPMKVRLIFDPITGDVIEADGSGRLRIRLEDEQVTMYGRFDISGGSYNFVSGDIFARRFNLSPGGSIVWEGSPTDARLNLEAVYQARPDINTLTRARADIDSETSQRVPVELVLNIGGSLSSIENNFFFRLPNTFETQQNSTLATQINALNRNEDEKLIQATSFLLMGDFIPSATANTDATNSLTNNLSGSAAVLNPLLSSQVISPLLSNQINSLLRSDIGSLDIDFNLNTYNNVDLGVALRLYNDRIILSREGQITGAQSNIGDLGATYRINQTLSVTAFHRQDPTFSTITGSDEAAQSQDINGIGLEAELSFNTWNEFLRKITTPFRKLFGIKEKETEVAANKNDNIPS